MGIIRLRTDGSCPVLSSRSNFIVALPQLGSSNVSSNSTHKTHKSGSSNVQSSATGHCNGHRKQSMLWDVSTACYKCRRTYCLPRACGVHALETHSQRQTCVFSPWLTSCGVYCVQDLALNRPWHIFTLVRLAKHSANHSRHCKPSCSRRCDAVSLGQQLPTFRRIVFSSSWDSSKSSSTVWHWGEGSRSFETSATTRKSNRRHVAFCDTAVIISNIACLLYSVKTPTACTHKAYVHMTCFGGRPHCHPKGLTPQYTQFKA